MSFLFLFGSSDSMILIENRYPLLNKMISLNLHYIFTLQDEEIIRKGSGSYTRVVFQSPTCNATWHFMHPSNFFEADI